MIVVLNRHIILHSCSSRFVRSSLCLHTVVCALSEEIEKNKRIKVLSNGLLSIDTRRGDFVNAFHESDAIHRFLYCPSLILRPISHVCTVSSAPPNHLHQYQGIRRPSRVDGGLCIVEESTPHKLVQDFLWDI